MKPIVRSFLVLLALSVSGCASTTLYSWGSYERGLYKYYKSPDEINTLIESLVGDFENADANERVVAPGLFAECGYLLIEARRPSEAIPYFEREKAAWPESAILMNRMIASAQG